MRTLLKDLFAQEGIETLSAVDGIAGLKLLDQQASEPILVVADVMMPGMDGLTFARKAVTRLKRGRVALISGHLTDTSWWPADLRSVSFLAKPFAMADVLALLAEARLSYGSDA